jgi:hypothetical protein
MEKINKGAIIIDAFNVLTDDNIIQLKRSNFSVIGVGKGHIKNLDSI